AYYALISPLSQFANLIQKCVDPSFYNKDTFLCSIDMLPCGVDWQCHNIHLTEGHVQTENLELWFRDPLKCIRELLNNLTFCDVTFYLPE
ncbi:hypothetical protein A0H81_10831, partial [Grifola frondosa]